jgi:hypothetical protein
MARRKASETTLVNVGFAAGSASKMAAILPFTQA